MAWKPFLSASFPPFPDPSLGEWDQSAFLALDFRKRVQWMRAACAVQGNQSLLGWAFHLGKACLYLYLFLLFCVRPGESETRTLIRLLAYSSLWECAGLGYGSGPSSGRFLPPVLVSFFHFIYMGTAKVPTRLLPPPLRGSRRGVVEVGLFSLYLTYSVKLALGGKTESESQLALIWIAVCSALGVLDQVFFFAGRSEVVGSMMVAVLLEEVVGGEAKSAVGLILVLIGWWTAVGKLEAWYWFGAPSVTCHLAPAAFKQALYRDWPGDLSPSRLARVGAVLGLGMELAFPVCLAIGGATWMGAAAGLHLVATGASLERSVFALLIAAYSFTSGTGNVFAWLQRAVVDGHYAGAVATFPGLPSAPVLLYIGVAHVLVPLFGMVHPDRLPRLLTSQAAGGNSPVSCWLIKRTAVGKLDLLWSFSSLPNQQLARLYLASALEQWEYRALCESTLRQPNARALLDILPACCGAGDALDDYWIVDGAAFAGAALGWSCELGAEDGALLSEVQQRCHFAAHELKHIYIGPVSLATGEAPWRVADQDSRTTLRGPEAKQL